MQSACVLQCATFVLISIQTNIHIHIRKKNIVYSSSLRRACFLWSSLIFRFLNTIAGFVEVSDDPPKDGVVFSSNVVKRSECNVTLAVGPAFTIGTW